MTCYVDEKTKTKRRPHKHAAFCQMIADTESELHQMATRLELDRASFSSGQYTVPYKLHQRAIDNGAVEVPRRTLGAMAMLKRCGQPVGDPNTAVERMHEFFKLAPVLPSTAIKEDA